MNKQAFLTQLRKKLSALPQNEIAERLTFYSEMIDDRMEEGLSEEEAVAAIGAVDITSGNKKAKRKLHPWEITLLALGCPVWLSLLIAAFAVIISLYASLWAIIISLWAAFGALVGGAFGGIVAGLGVAFGSSMPSGIAIVGAGILCAGLAIFLFFGCKATTKGTLSLTKKSVLGIKNRFQGKEAV